MVWIFLEAGLALVLAVLIVWWTMPSRRRTRPDDNRGKGKGPGTDGA